MGVYKGIAAVLRVLLGRSVEVHLYWLEPEIRRVFEIKGKKRGGGEEEEENLEFISTLAEIKWECTREL